MTNENGGGTATSIKAEEAGKRQRSSIAFPYMDLSEAIALATAIHNNVGTGTCSVEQLAPWLNPKNGNCVDLFQNTLRFLRRRADQQFA